MAYFLTNKKFPGKNYLLNIYLQSLKESIVFKTKMASLLFIISISTLSFAADTTNAFDTKGYYKLYRVFNYNHSIINSLMYNFNTFYFKALLENLF
jgi:hypothetical protein